MKREEQRLREITLDGYHIKKDGYDTETQDEMACYLKLYALRKRMHDPLSRKDS